MVSTASQPLRVIAGRVAKEKAPNLRQARLNQERINIRLEEVQERLQEIVERAQENRLTILKELPWIEGLREAVDAP